MRINKVLKLGLILTLTGALMSACFFGFGFFNDEGNKSITKALIVPHHLIVYSDIDKIFEENADEETDLVILLSVNHFNDGMSKIQTADSFENSDILVNKNSQNVLTIQNIVSLDNKTFIREHGIFVHLDNIKKNFPNASLLPLIFKEDTPKKNIDELVSILDEYLSKTDENVVLILSMDFNHYQAEEIAYESDMEIIDYLQSISENKIDFKTLKAWAKTEENLINFDSPEGLYVLLKLLEQQKKLQFNFVKRTSSAEITKISDQEMNTSHVFGWF